MRPGSCCPAGRPAAPAARRGPGLVQCLAGGRAGGRGAPVRGRARRRGCQAGRAGGLRLAVRLLLRRGLCLSAPPAAFVPTKTPEGTPALGALTPERNRHSRPQRPGLGDHPTGAPRCCSPVARVRGGSFGAPRSRAGALPAGGPVSPPGRFRSGGTVELFGTRSAAGKGELLR